MGTGDFQKSPVPIPGKCVMIMIMLISGGENVDNRKIVLPDKVKRIILNLQSHGYEAYAVGGCVRD